MRMIFDRSPGRRRRREERRSNSFSPFFLFENVDFTASTQVAVLPKGKKLRHSCVRHGGGTKCISNKQTQKKGLGALCFFSAPFSCLFWVEPFGDTFSQELGYIFLFFLLEEGASFFKKEKKKRNLTDRDPPVPKSGKN